MTKPQRVEAMARRLAAAAASAGLSETELVLLDAAYRLAAGTRAAQLPDERDPLLLHPARTALILLEDLRVIELTVLAAAALCDTLHPQLVPAADEIERAVGAETRKRLGQVPIPAVASDRLLEELLALAEPLQLLALTERLDHARHLHLRPREEWRAQHIETCTVYLPVAERLHPLLRRRFRWWCNMFAKRYLGRGK